MSFVHTGHGGRLSDAGSGPTSVVTRAIAIATGLPYKPVYDSLNAPTGLRTGSAIRAGRQDVERENRRVRTDAEVHGVSRLDVDAHCAARIPELS